MVKTFRLAGIFIDLQVDGTLKQDTFFFCVHKHVFLRIYWSEPDGADGLEDGKMF